METVKVKINAGEEFCFDHEGVCHLLGAPRVYRREFPYKIVKDCRLYGVTLKTIKNGPAYRCDECKQSVIED